MDPFYKYFYMIQRGTGTLPLATGRGGFVGRGKLTSEFVRIALMVVPAVCLITKRKLGHPEEEM
jgi:hypothetical protein